MTGDGLLQDARARYDARDFAGTAELIERADASRRIAEPEIGFLLAASWRQLGRTHDALALAGELTDPILRRGTPRLELRRINLEAMLLFEAGSVGAAEALWLHLHGRASVEGDAEYVAHASNNLGVVYTLQMRMDEALASYERAMLAYWRLGERLGLAQSHQNLGMAHRESGRPEEADEHFESARYHATAAADHRLLGRIESERALLLARRGDHRVAEATARRARSRLQLVGDLAGTGEAWRTTGLIAIAAGRHGEAIDPLGQAVDISRQTGHALLEAEALLGLAVARAGTATTESEAARTAAYEIFERIGAMQWCRAMEHWLIEPGATLD